MPNSIALEIYFVFGNKFSWNEGIDACFSVECVLLGRNLDFFGGYCSIPGDYWWLLLVTNGYCSLPLGAVRSTLSMNDFIYIFCRSFIYLNRKKVF